MEFLSSTDTIGVKMISLILNKRVVFLVGMANGVVMVLTPFWKSVTINLIMTTKHIFSIMLLSFSMPRQWVRKAERGVPNTCASNCIRWGEAGKDSVVCCQRTHCHLTVYTARNYKGHRRSKTNWPVWAVTAVRKFNLQQEDVLTEAANLYLGLYVTSKHPTGVEWHVRPK